MSKEHFIVENNGPDVVGTNFWASTLNREGIIFLSFNAGAVRVLLSTKHRRMLRDMKTAKYVVVSRGPWLIGDAYELLFEDETDYPFSLHTLVTAADRTLPAGDHGKPLAVSVWTQGNDGRPRCELRRRGIFRMADRLPCLKPWKGGMP